MTIDEVVVGSIWKWNPKEVNIDSSCVQGAKVISVEQDIIRYACIGCDLDYTALSLGQFLEKVHQPQILSRLELLE